MYKMKTKYNTYPPRRRPCRPNPFEIQLNRFFYRAFGWLSLFILVAVILTGAYHHLVTVIITAVVSWKIYDDRQPKTTGKPWTPK